MSSETEEKRFLSDAIAERRRIESRLEDWVDAQSSAPPNIREALGYSLLGAGKRLRPILCLWTHDAVGGARREACLDAACALECLHTYSLVHDDLPCMDDDDLRRGKPSCHRRFGEAVAVLTGDLLQAICFEILTTMGERWRVPNELTVASIQTVARAAGAGGLITGQALDLCAEDSQATLVDVEQIHRHKTAALIAAAMTTGAVLGGATTEKREAIFEAGMLAGEAFQIVDDLLDLETNSEKLGKTAGKDVRSGKVTYPSVMGVEVSRRRAGSLIVESKSRLADSGNPVGLYRLLDYMVERDR